MIIKSINSYINSLLRVVLSMFMTVMIVAVVWQVFTRFVLQDPSAFTDELSRYLLIWIGVLGGAYTFAIKRHLALELLAPRMGHNGQLVLGIIINLVIIAFAAVTFIYGGTALVTNTLKHGQISPGIVIGGHHLLIGYVYVVVPLAGYIISYFGTVDVISSVLSLVNKEERVAAEGYSK
ncbi:TRAP-type C4-dicarboxylate transport system permease small subunit [Vibrio diazotrophicus]|uniref:TRAP transporter small permease protein n=2 Tax=Vibrio diazotrophicus TaxID=685 RepID=A0A329EEK0_VIBDI|nr:TRAP-type C4-dicarboxylate transport system permease small subunit [Vibrio diazotrophicus]